MHCVLYGYKGVCKYVGTISTPSHHDTIVNKHICDKCDDFGNLNIFEKKFDLPISQEDIENMNFPYRKYSYNGNEKLYSPLFGTIYKDENIVELQELNLEYIPNYICIEDTKYKVEKVVYSVNDNIYKVYLDYHLRDYSNDLEECMQNIEDIQNRIEQYNKTLSSKNKTLFKNKLISKLKNIFSI